NKFLGRCTQSLHHWICPPRQSRIIQFLGRCTRTTHWLSSTSIQNKFSWSLYSSHLPLVVLHVQSQVGFLVAVLSHFTIGLSSTSVSDHRFLGRCTQLPFGLSPRRSQNKFLVRCAQSTSPLDCPPRQSSLISFLGPLYSVHYRWFPPFSQEFLGRCTQSFTIGLSSTSRLKSSVSWSAVLSHYHWLFLTSVSEYKFLGLVLSLNHLDLFTPVGLVIQFLGGCAQSFAAQVFLHVQSQNQFLGHVFRSTTIDSSSVSRISFLVMCSVAIGLSSTSVSEYKFLGRCTQSLPLVVLSPVSESVSWSCTQSTSPLDWLLHVGLRIIGFLINVLGHYHWIVLHVNSQNWFLGPLYSSHFTHWLSSTSVSHQFLDSLYSVTTIGLSPLIQNTLGHVLESFTDGCSSMSVSNRFSWSLYFSPLYHWIVLTSPVSE
ncbi:hypothetical protein AVEN_172149-1, partial [Araneus ventricosus]